MLVNVIYNIADTFFVGQTGDENQVAAVTITMPIFLLMLSFSNIFAIGGGAYISRLLGEKNFKKIKNVSSFCMYFSIFLTMIFSVFLLTFMDSILSKLGADKFTFEFAKSYLKIIAIGSIFISIQATFAGLIRAEGSAKDSMIGMIIGTIINIILDPIMILFLKLGVAGAGIATIIGNIASCVYYIFYCLFKKTTLSMSIKKFLFEKSILKNVFMIGIPVSINTVLVSFASIILNNFTKIYGNDALAAIGIANRINTFSIMSFVGLSQGAQPFIAYNYASKNYERMKQALKFTIKVSMVIGLTLIVSIVFFSEDIVKTFIDKPSVIEYGKYFTIVTMSVAPIFGIQFIIMSTFQATGKSLPALFISISRQGLVFVPAIILGNKFLGLNGVIWAQPFADFMSVVLSLSMLFFLRKSLGLSK